MKLFISIRTAEDVGTRFTYKIDETYNIPLADLQRIFHHPSLWAFGQHGVCRVQYGDKSDGNWNEFTFSSKKDLRHKLKPCIEKELLEYIGETDGEVQGDKG